MENHLAVFMLTDLAAIIIIPESLFITSSNKLMIFLKKVGANSII